ncbi:DUF2905 domain-containing protein [Thermosipho ferrireducens]|uniref:DUF2905 domain-containing protein n=1 Tax=Thermosipho ferrireducens TaxID=2571116 RepID=A0ABX7S7P9_9BACT|nr:DUF2905 domain-containing protein [Thermosipho ferrireducens]
MGIGKLLIVTGITILIIGILFYLMEKVNLFHLPGDIVIKRKNITIFIPVTSMIIISIILTVIFNVLFRR